MPSAAWKHALDIALELAPTPSTVVITSSTIMTVSPIRRVNMSTVMAFRFSQASYRETPEARRRKSRPSTRELVGRRA